MLNHVVQKMMRVNLIEEDLVVEQAAAHGVEERPAKKAVVAAPVVDSVALARAAKMKAVAKKVPKNLIV